MNEDNRQIGYEMLCENALQRGEVFNPYLNPVPPPVICTHPNYHHKPGYGMDDYLEFVKEPVHNCILYTATPGTIGVLPDVRNAPTDILCWNKEECAPEFREAEAYDYILVELHGKFSWMLYTNYMEWYFK